MVAHEGIVSVMSDSHGHDIVSSLLCAQLRTTRSLPPFFVLERVQDHQPHGHVSGSAPSCASDHKKVSDLL